MNAAVTQKLKNIPLTSGVYLMKNADGRVIYVGKAVSLRRRVQSYFRPSLDRQAPLKTDRLVCEVADIDYIEAASEAGALILEAGLIKQHKPKYNVELKDDKSYPVIEVTGEVFPRISIQRPTLRQPHHRGAKYYGPYVNAGLVRDALTIIRKIFPFRTCDPLPKKECLDYHIGLCEAPCIQKIKKRDYARNIRNVCLVLEGKKDILYKRLRREMEALVKGQKFEQAARVRDQMRSIGALYSGTGDINYYKESEQLKRALGLPRLPERIETFDISNMMGHQAVGSMVAFFNGKPDKNNYRRFRIKEVEGIDDFQMMAEVVRRRYRRLQEESGAFPDLIVIDGGKGQLSFASRELELLGADIPIIALAKKEEEVFLPKKRNAVLLPQNSLALRLLRRMRDEAHRFAISYHRRLRSKQALGKEEKN
jgi:excinuclease ABC subunit C